MRRFLVLLLCLGLWTIETADGIEADGSLNPKLQALAQEFFGWRAIQQPATGDDIPRVERPDGWVPDWSPAALTRYRAAYRVFLARLGELDHSDWSKADQVDARLLRAAILRVRWELDILRSPHRNPLFYIDQTLGSVFELLIISSPITPQRAENIVLRLEAFPELTQAAYTNLDQAVRPFSRAAITMLAGIDERLKKMRVALQLHFPEELRERMQRATRGAVSALQAYSRWLRSADPIMTNEFSLGTDAYSFFLANVALIPHTPGELLAQGRLAWERAVTFDTLEKNRNASLESPAIFDDLQAQIDTSRRMEGRIRQFLEAHNLMTVPSWLKRYLNRPLPDHLAPLAFMGVTDDLTSETRLDEHAISYVPDPSPDLPYFYLATAQDPRPLIVHEGVPGHYFQLAQSWKNPDPVRRRYIDSGANEGIGFYVEEMLLQAGLFDDSPKTREIIYSFMRLRALRVEVDIRLATGDFTIEQAGAYLARTVPMDLETATKEAVFFAFNPGQAISYQIGALQIIRFLSDARLDLKDDFSLRHFHDSLMQNGNVPIALQRWEYLDRADEINRLDEMVKKAISITGK
ncbi:MAG: DUF885 family protein [Gammaproteobacteria bacterium]|nr:DUF885 family protein [Gammaproteobacteria bacterium]MCZ6687280.1 DUF885 family protein [Gammaproteobacteria bacterium]